jgi:hypothetical protein
MLFRLTNKLFKRLREHPPLEVDEAPNPFLDWAADHFTVQGYRFILITNCASVLSWVYPARGVNDPSDFIWSTMVEMEVCMREYGFDMHWERIMGPSFGKVRFRRVADRSMNGILVNLAMHAKYYLSYPDLSHYEVSLLLNEIPQCSRKETCPIQAFAQLSLNPQAVSTPDH